MNQDCRNLNQLYLKKKKDELIDSWHVVTDSRSKVLSANQTAEFLNQLNSK